MVKGSLPVTIDSDSRQWQAEAEDMCKGCRRDERG